MKTYDVIIVGSGIGGLCCGSLLSLHGLKVLICEAHTKPGGVAHSFERNGYKFESGPSLWSGLGRNPTNNPLGQILRLLNQNVDLIKYKGWKVLFPETHFDLEVGNNPFRNKIKNLRGEDSLKEWDKFISSVKPLSNIVNNIPLLASSPQNLNLFEGLDLARKILPNINQAFKLTKSFGYLVDENLNDPFLRNWVDLLSFLISGLPMHDTNTAAMATLFSEWFEPEAYLEYPRGGSETIVNALVQGFKNNGGDLLLSSRVKEIKFTNSVASGVVLEKGLAFSAKNIVTNCDIWNTFKLLPNGITKKFKSKTHNPQKCDSFLHIHLGFDAKDLNNLPIHTIYVDNWARGVSAERNIAVFSIPSVLDCSMAPKGKHVLHGYTPANEPWEIWKNISRDSKAYQKLKETRCSIFINSLKKFIPDIEERIEFKMLGTPLTHQRFTNTEQGSYGPAISASKSLFPNSRTPIKNLYTCGASTFPGIGIPAVAASGAYAAEAIIGKKNYKRLISPIISS
tara:strand:- start:428 stop:1960 length:1533 start_codon:yes stop_codon:yes gene_type:complete